MLALLHLEFLIESDYHFISQLHHALLDIVIELQVVLTLEELCRFSLLLRHFYRLKNRLLRVEIFYRREKGRVWLAFRAIEPGRGRGLLVKTTSKS